MCPRPQGEPAWEQAGHRGPAWRDQTRIAQASLGVLWPPLSDGVMALSRSSIIIERVMSLMRSGIAAFRIRGFCYPPLPLFTLLFTSLKKGPCRSLLQIFFSLVAWGRNGISCMKKQVKCNLQNVGQRVQQESQPWAWSDCHRSPRKEHAPCFSWHRTGHSAFACKILSCKPGTRAAQSCLWIKSEERSPVKPCQLKFLTFPWLYP